MKNKLLQIRVDEEFLSKLEYLRKINGYHTIAETVRKIIEKEWRKEKNDWKDKHGFITCYISVSGYFVCQCFVLNLKFIYKQTRMRSKMITPSGYRCIPVTKNTNKGVSKMQYLILYENKFVVTINAPSLEIALYLANHEHPEKKKS